MKMEQVEGPQGSRGGPESYWGELFSCVYSGEFEEVVELFMTWEANKVCFFFLIKMERKPSVYIVLAGWESIGLKFPGKKIKYC